MIRQHLTSLPKHEHAAHLACGEAKGGWVEIDESSDCYRQILKDRAELRVSNPDRAKEPAKPVPREQWPAQFKALAAFANQDDKGLGDTFARLTAATGVSAVVHAVTAALKTSCGCAGRRASWNVLYPL